MTTKPRSAHREAWTPAKRRAAAEAARIQWSDQDQKAAALVATAVGIVVKAVERDPETADVLIVAAIDARRRRT